MSFDQNIRSCLNLLFNGNFYTYIDCGILHIIDNRFYEYYLFQVIYDTISLQCSEHNDVLNMLHKNRMVDQ